MSISVPWFVLPELTYHLVTSLSAGEGLGLQLEAALRQRGHPLRRRGGISSRRLRNLALGHGERRGLRRAAEACGSSGFQGFGNAQTTQGKLQVK